MKVIENFNISTEFKDLSPGDIFRTIYTEQYHVKCSNRIAQGLLWNAVRLSDGEFAQVNDDLEVYKCGDIEIGRLGIR